LATIKGTTTSNTLVGTSSTDSIYGYAGNDSLSGRAGNDSIWGGDGSDSIWGESGNDTLRGEALDDHIYSGDGDDLVYGGAGNDQLFGDGGTDKIYGEAGNDILKGGLGKALLYGGDGNDTLYYGPSEADIGKLGTSFSGSALNGDTGTDTLHVYNSATFGPAKTPAHTNIFMWDGYHTEGELFFSNHSGNTGMSGPSEESIDFGNNVGFFANIEHLTFTGKGGVTYTSPNGNNPNSITGTAGNDFFYADASLDGHVVTYKGGGGNDYFSVGAGDKIISETSDSDTFYLNVSVVGKTTTITGFNGAGVAGGDIARFTSYVLPDPDKQITEASGWTTFSLDDGGTVKIQGVGLDMGVDYFIV
jgi:hemolysin type calcium-binding protein